MDSRLELIDLGLFSLVNSFTLVERKLALVTLVEYLASRANWDETWIAECVSLIQSKNDVPNILVEKVEVLVDKLDQEYLILSEEFENGVVDQSEVIHAFSLARATNALLWAAYPLSQTTLSEMIYEVVMAFDNLDEIKNILITIRPTTF